MKIFFNFKPYLTFLEESLNDLITDRNINRILIVDNNKSILKAMVRLARNIIKTENLPFEVIKAYDGVEALGILKLDLYLKRSIKIIISDHIMTTMNGAEFFQLLIKYFRDLKLGNPPKLFMCSTDNNYLKDLKLEGVQFLNKPASRRDMQQCFN